MADTLYTALLTELCDGLISLQDTSGDPAFHGGVHCRACKCIHGRCPDAVFPFVVAYKQTHDAKYLAAAEAVFDYGENLLCTDGGMYNDAQNTWRCTTTFHLIAAVEALSAGGDLLPAAFRQKLTHRIEKTAAWVCSNVDEKAYANINYPTVAGFALALSGRMLGSDAYIRQGKKLVDYAVAHITENGFLYGECKPHGKRSAKGCLGVDIGYNVEESIPALVKYACLVGDEALKDRLTEVLRAQLDFLFPDGAWDNSFGVRNNKWTYYGSRTSDGCQPAYLLLSDRDPRFREAALRNLEQIAACTAGTFLYGGPHYARHGEYPCTHHAFEHLNAIAFAVENIPAEHLAFTRVPLPCDAGDGCRYYPEVATVKMSRGDYLATVTDYDFDVFFSGHAAGGTLCALYDRKTNTPMVMASVTDYILVEPFNMQQVRDRAHHRSLTPRLVLERDGTVYQSSYFTDSDMTVDVPAYRVTVKTGLSDRRGASPDLRPTVTYELTEDGMAVTITDCGDARFLLPLIAGRADILCGTPEKEEDIFFLTGGFRAREMTIAPVQGSIRLIIR